MVPGMQHCSGGPGTSTFDMLDGPRGLGGEGQGADAIPASHVAAGAVVRTRPLCLYPSVAAYTGSGRTDDAANFTCRAPENSARK